MSERREHLDTTALAVIIGCCVIWGLGQVVAKVALEQIPPITQAGIRSIGATILLWTWARYRRISLDPRDGTWWPGVWAGVLFAVEFALIYWGLQHTTAGRMTIFLYTAPFVVAAGMPLISPSERPRPVQVAGLVGAFAGVVLAFGDGFSHAAVSDLQWLGDIAGLAAAVFWGATTLVVRATSLAQADPAKTLLYQLGVSAVLLTAVGIATEPAPQWPLTPLVWGSLAFQIVLHTSVGYLAWFWLLRSYPATKVSSFTLLAPVLSVLFGAALLSEPVTWTLLVALVTVCFGIYLVNRRPRRAVVPGEP